MRHRLSVRGISLIEFLGASMIATVVGGAMILLMNGMRQAYQTHLAFQQLSGYLDAASTTLRNDIWAATGSCQTGCPGGVATAGLWLALDLPKTDGTTGWGTGPDVRYFVDQTDETDASNVKLKRQVYNDVTSSWGAAWSVAQYLIPPSNPPAGGTGTTATVSNGLVSLALWVSRTINGRTYSRQMINLAYRMQVPS